MKSLFAFVTVVPAAMLLSFTPAALGQNTFSGQAAAVSGSVAGLNLDLADTGPLPSSGGAQENSLASASVPNVLTADVLHASTVGQGDRSRSEASLADLSLTVAGNAIAADFLLSRSMAVCTGNGPATSGSSEIVNLAINNMSVGVSGQPNQTVPLPGGGEIIINEQNNDHPGSITVNALHVIVPGLMGVPATDLVISSAHADVTCQGPPNCNSSNDFVTGGGWIPTQSDPKANFAVAGGVKNGGLWGHLQYIDHGTGMKVKGTGVTKYMVTGPTTRHIEGTADIDGNPGTYVVDVGDNGEPGKGVDVFSMTLSNGYTGAGNLSGGNIQLHKVCQ
jgi:hypothetical protein